MELSEREWGVLKTMCQYFLDGIDGDIEKSGYVTCYNTLIREEVELLKKIAK